MHKQTISCTIGDYGLENGMAWRYRERGGERESLRQWLVVPFFSRLMRMHLFFYHIYKATVLSVCSIFFDALQDR